MYALKLNKIDLYRIIPQELKNDFAAIDSC